MKRPSKINFALSLLAALVSIGARGSMGSGYEFEGIGAREVSRGGAAIADSADWSAIYWNPANVRKAVEKEKANIGLEVFGGQARGHDSNSLSNLIGPLFSKTELNSNFILGAGGAAVRAGRFGLGFGIYTPLLQGSDFSDTSASGQTLHYKASAGIVTGSLVASMQVAEKLYAGVGLDILYGRIKSDTTLTNFGIPGNTATSHQEGDGTGLEGIAGLRYEPNPKWIIGAVYRSGADVEIRGRADADMTFGSAESSNFRYELRHPPTAGLGLAHRFSDRWSVHADLTETFWHRFTNEFNYDQTGLLIRDQADTFKWKDTLKVRLGTGFQITDKTELLGGYSYDQPALDSGSIDFSSAIDVPMNRLYTGGSHRWNSRWESILGGIYGWGHRSESDASYRLSGWQVMFETQVHVGSSE